MRPHKRSDAELGLSQKIAPGLEGFDQISGVKPGPERSEGPALQVGPSGQRGAERAVRAQQKKQIALFGSVASRGAEKAMAVRPSLFTIHYSLFYC